MEFCTAVMTGGFGVLSAAVESVLAYVERHQTRVADLTGVAADQLQSFGEQPHRPDHWRNFVPAQTRFMSGE